MLSPQVLLLLWTEMLHGGQIQRVFKATVSMATLVQYSLVLGNKM